MDTFEKTPLTADELRDYLDRCSYQEWVDETPEATLELIKEQNGEPQISDKEILAIVKEWIATEQDNDSEDDDSWQRERAMLAGMTHGVQAYNDIMGYSESEYSCYSCGDRGCQYCDYS